MAFTGNHVSDELQAGADRHVCVWIILSVTGL